MLKSFAFNPACRTTVKYRSAIRHDLDGDVIFIAALMDIIGQHFVELCAIRNRINYRGYWIVGWVGGIVAGNSQLHVFLQRLWLRLFLRYKLSLSNPMRMSSNLFIKCVEAC
jgi:hypothetical protein